MDNHGHFCSLAATSQERYSRFRYYTVTVSPCNPTECNGVCWTEGCRLKQATQAEYEQKINLQRQQAHLNRSWAHGTENMSIRIVHNITSKMLEKALRQNKAPLPFFAMSSWFFNWPSVTPCALGHAIQSIQEIPGNPCPRPAREWSQPQMPGKSRWWSAIPRPGVLRSCKIEAGPPNRRAFVLIPGGNKLCSLIEIWIPGRVEYPKNYF